MIHKRSTFTLSQAILNSQCALSNYMHTKRNGQNFCIFHIQGKLNKFSILPNATSMFFKRKRRCICRKQKVCLYIYKWIKFWYLKDNFFCSACQGCWIRWSLPTQSILCFCEFSFIAPLDLVFLDPRKHFNNINLTGVFSAQCVLGM